jgi:hypothetical protein
MAGVQFRFAIVGVKAKKTATDGAAVNLKINEKTRLL